jgi:hypothetical protein
VPDAPQLTPEQRSAALRSAAAARTARARAKAELAAGSVRVGELLERARQDPALAAMRVSALISALPGYGPVRTGQLMADLRIAETRRISGLGPNQRVALLARLGEPAQSPA